MAREEKGEEEESAGWVRGRGERGAGGGGCRGRDGEAESSEKP